MFFEQSITCIYDCRVVYFLWPYVDSFKFLRRKFWLWIGRGEWKWLVESKMKVHFVEMEKYPGEVDVQLIKRVLVLFQEKLVLGMMISFY